MIKQITRRKLNKILELHKKWLNGEEDGERADLSNADLKYVNLRGTDLRCADLSGANLCYAKLETTILDEEEQIRKGIVLKDQMIGYKKCREDIIVTLEIPKGAIVFSINNEKCRTNKAKVIDISDNNKIAYSIYDNDFKYEIGKEIEAEDFNMQYNRECTTGIHFYRTEEEAENW